MLLNAEHARFDLAEDQVAHLTDACDSRIQATDGFVWLTIEGDRGDIVLRPGESYVVDAGETVTVSALRGAAAIEVRAHAGGRCAAATRPLSRPGWRERLFAGVTLSSSALA